MNKRFVLFVVFVCGLSVVILLLVLLLQIQTKEFAQLIFQLAFKCPEHFPSSNIPAHTTLVILYNFPGKRALP